MAKTDYSFLNSDSLDFIDDSLAARPEFGNFLDIVRSSGSGASSLLGQGGGHKLRDDGDGVIELGSFSGAKGGIPGPPPKDPEPEPEPEPTPGATYTSGSSSVDDSQEFNIKVEFSGSGWTEEFQNIFIAVADYFSSVIANDLQDITYQGESYDDITIDASIAPIDGSGGILGQAGATLIRTDGSLPLAAVMEFDSADAEDYANLGLFDDIVFHEMMHCLGFSDGIWDRQGLFATFVDDNGTKRPIDDTIDYRFIGEQATIQYNEDNSTAGDPLAAQGVPLETNGGSGTAGSHWDDATFGNEIMTGYINLTNDQEDMTLAALADMGYVVDDYSFDFV